MSSSFTQEDLTAIENAIAKGALVVKYSDKEVRYRNLDDMFKTRDFIKRCLAGGERGTRRVATHSKGLC